MDFELTSEQLALQETARGFADEKLWPHAGKWDHDFHFPLDVLREAAALGFAGIYLPEDVGGSNLTRLDGSIIFEALATGCVSTTAFLTVHNMVAWIIHRYAKPEIKSKLLPKMAKMEMLGSYCLTEATAGSDAGALKSTAKRDGDSYTINGNKVFISGGGASDVYIVFARTGGEGTKGISAFLVPKDAKGISFGKPEHKMGWRNQPTTTVTLENVKVPASHLLAQEGEGFKVAMSGLDGGRINIASISLGGAQRALDLSTAYVKEREQFGKPLADLQSIQFKLADMSTNLDAARLLTRRAGASFDAGSDMTSTHAAMAKRFASDTAFQVADDALQLHGGYGYIHEYQIERIFRDLRVNRILEGTNEIMRVIIARKLLAS
jgi:alkylation response protein AidB-like acyl-CoA dehydrogenase